MANKLFYILHFGNGEPSWAFFDGMTLKSVDPPSGRPRHAVLALIPDKHFFFFQPKRVEGRVSPKVRTAALLQMQYQFPRASERQDQGILQGQGGAMLGYFSGPGFAEFWEKHKALLDKANVVSTSFVLAWQAAQALERDSFTWETPDGYTAIKAGEQLFYFQGGSQELDTRVKTLEEGDMPEELTLEQVLGALSEGRVKFSRLRLLLERAEGVESVDTRGWSRAFVAVAIIGLFFCAGEIGRYFKLDKEVKAWSTSVDSAYAQVLGPGDLGHDPYGRLLSRLSQLKGSRTQGIPLLELLETLSRASPQGFTVENMNLNGLSGSLRARIGTFNQLETMLATLQQEKSFAFTLDQAVNTTKDILITLRVDFKSLR